MYQICAAKLRSQVLEKIGPLPRERVPAVSVLEKIGALPRERVPAVSQGLWVQEHVGDNRFCEELAV